MSEKYSPSDLIAVTLNQKDPPNCDITLQIQPVSAVDGKALGIWTIDDKFINGIGVAMGGYLSAAADTMMAYAIASVLESGQTFTTIDLHTTYHRPVLVGEAEVQAQVVTKGKRMAYLSAEIYQNGKKCCSAVSSIMIITK